MTKKKRDIFLLLFLGALLILNSSDSLFDGEKTCEDFFNKNYENAKVHHIVPKSSFSIGKFEIFYRDIGTPYEENRYSTRKCSVDYINGFVQLHGLLNFDW